MAGAELLGSRLRLCGGLGQEPFPAAVVLADVVGVFNGRDFELLVVGARRTVVVPLHRFVWERVGASGRGWDSVACARLAPACRRRPARAHKRCARSAAALLLLLLRRRRRARACRVARPPRCPPDMCARI